MGQYRYLIALRCKIIELINVAFAALQKIGTVCSSIYGCNYCNCFFLLFLLLNNLISRIFPFLSPNTLVDHNTWRFYNIVIKSSWHIRKVH